MKIRKKRKLRKSLKFLLWTGICLSLIFVQTRMNVLINASEPFFCGHVEHTHEIDCYRSDVPLCELEEHQHLEECSQEVLTCLEEESEESEHLHQEDCFEISSVCTQEVHEHSETCMLSRTPLCGLEEHIHVRECASNTEADLENMADWENQLKNLPEDKIEKILEITSRQIGYQESEKNFKIDELENIKGYSRYGQFASDPYGTWNLYFISYVLHFADASIFEETGYGAARDIFQMSLAEWASYTERNPGFIQPLDYQYKAGDLVYVDILDQEAVLGQTLGIISKVSEENGKITAVFGDFYNEVVEVELNTATFDILGFIETKADEKDEDVQLPSEPSDPDEEDLDNPVTNLLKGLDEAEDDEESIYLIGNPVDSELYILDELSEVKTNHFDFNFTVNEEAYLAETFGVRRVAAQLLPVIENEALESGIELIAVQIDVSESENNEDSVSEEDSAGDEAESAVETETTPADEASKEAEDGSEADETDEKDDGKAVEQILINEQKFNIELMDAQGESLVQDGIKLTANVMPNSAYRSEIEKTVESMDELTGKESIEIRTQTINDEETEVSDPILSSHTEYSPMVLSLNSAREIVITATAPKDLEYVVQYYVNTDTLVTRTTGDGFTIIDTKMQDGVSWPNNLPQNLSASSDPVPGSTFIPLKGDGSKNDGKYTVGQQYTADTTKKLVKYYKNKTYTYNSRNTVDSINLITKNEGFVLSEIWHQEKDSSGSVVSANWIKNTNPSKVTFTNNPSQASANKILITPNTVIRMVYEEQSVTEQMYDAYFYDYDITENNVMSNQKGINNPANYSGTKTNNRFAFGNVAPGSGGYEKNQVNGYYINKNATQNSNWIYGGSFFGLAAQTIKNGEFKFASGVNGPSIFNKKAGAVHGQFIHPGKLGFKKVGNTYTITSAAIGNNKISGLDKFTHLTMTSSSFYNHKTGSKEKQPILSNNFWPLDNIKHNDPKTGTKTETHGGLTYYQSDDGKAHNNMFGMEFEIEFSISSDYVGPLEYRFYGDDDLWVYLDDKLIVDIGGVHSSIGQRVDLWDYLKKGEAGTHRLKMFYTERGLYGSTCYMTFTLPGVSEIPVGRATGDLRLEKTGVNVSPDEDFKFQFNLTGGSASINDLFAYDVYESGTNSFLYRGYISNGGDLSIKANQYALIKYLPDGIKFKVEEDLSGYSPGEFTVYSTNSNNTTQSSTSLSGTIGSGQTSQISFNNVRNLVMPETGGEGTSWFFQYGIFTMLIGGAGLVLALRMKEKEE